MVQRIVMTILLGPLLVPAWVEALDEEYVGVDIYIISMRNRSNGPIQRGNQTAARVDRDSYGTASIPTPFRDSSNWEMKRISSGLETTLPC